MRKEPIFLEPIFQERIWGGTALRDQFGYEIPSDQTGECWAISAHPNGQSVVRSGEFKGKTLGELWDNHRELFGNEEGEQFPLLTKILDANKDLSVQVHPDDTYAEEHENGELGKTECWYIIDCAEEAELIYGHTAKTREQLKEMIDNGEWDKLLRRVKIKPGDFFYVPSGTIHALGAGTLVLETQQSSDTTYRVYDYDRVGDDGKKRELHLNQAIDVTTVPHEGNEIDSATAEVGESVITTYVESDFFTVYKWNVNGEMEFDQGKSFMLGSVLNGHGTIKTDDGTFEVKTGDHFILPYDLGNFSIDGHIELIVSHL